MKVRKIGKSYEVVTNYKILIVNHCSYKVLSNPTNEWSSYKRFENDDSMIALMASVLYESK